MKRRANLSTERLTRQRRHDVLESCQAIAGYTAGLDYAAYQADAMVRDAVERQLGIIGEALHHALHEQPELEAQIPELRRVVAMRHRVVHGYHALDNTIVWDVIQNKLPPLEASVAALLAEGHRA